MREQGRSGPGPADTELPGDEPPGDEPQREAGTDHGAVLLARYDEALPQVYGYLHRRCPTATLAEDLTAETFLAAVDSIRRGAVTRVTVAWLITIARNKLVDHWRRHEREQRGLQLVHDLAGSAGVGERGGATGNGRVDEWADEHDLDVTGALAALHTLGPHHQAALTLRYLDGLSVPNVADQLGRTVHATEALLVRARTAFRRAYEAQREAEELAATDGHPTGADRAPGRAPGPRPAPPPPPPAPGPAPGSRPEHGRRNDG